LFVWFVRFVAKKTTPPPERSRGLSHEPHEPHEREPDRGGPSKTRLSFERASGASSLCVSAPLR
jgi:hypothetical protein